jgi:hypothetical protein
MLRICGVARQFCKPWHTSKVSYRRCRTLLSSSCHQNIVICQPFRHASKCYTGSPSPPTRSFFDLLQFIQVGQGQFIDISLSSLLPLTEAPIAEKCGWTPRTRSGDTLFHKSIAFFQPVQICFFIDHLALWDTPQCGSVVDFLGIYWTPWQR